MGFLEGFGYKYVGSACVWGKKKDMENWTYWTDKTFRYDRTFFEGTTRLGRDVVHLDEVPESSIGDRLIKAKLQLAGNTVSKEHMAAIAAILLLPFGMLYALGRAKAIDAKDEALKQEAIKQVSKIRLTCINMHLKNGKEFTIAILPEVGKKIFSDYKEVNN